MKYIAPIVAISAVAVALSGCGGQPNSRNEQSSSAQKAITITNCGHEVTYDHTIDKLFANDGNIISISLAAGAYDQLVAVSSLERDQDVVALKYGDKVNQLNQVAGKYPTLENVIAANPQMVFAGWNYGFKDDSDLNPSGLKDRGIDSYILSESCRQEGGTSKARGTMDPWEALKNDISNIGILTGHSDEAKASIDDIEKRKEALEKAEKAERTPVGFLFDSASDTVFSSGRFGAPQAMMDVAGVHNALSDVDDTWTKVSWEKLASSQPDIFFFVDYPPQTIAEKIQALESNPATKDLPAVKERRYVNLPYAMWTSSPLNIDGAEYIRKSLEYFKLQPESQIEPQLDLTKLTQLEGNEWLTQR